VRHYSPMEITTASLSLGPVDPGAVLFERVCAGLVFLIEILSDYAIRCEWRKCRLASRSMKLIQGRVGIKGHEISGLSESHSTFSGEVQPLMVKPIVNPDDEESVNSFRVEFRGNCPVDEIYKSRIVLRDIRNRGAQEALVLVHLLN
jgi:hypothetical protein